MSGVRVSLDGERPTPPGWQGVRWFVPPAIIIHTANASGRERVLLGVWSIQRLVEQRNTEPGAAADVPRP